MLDVLWSVAAFIVAIGVLVSFHEYGHFVVARRLGVRVLRYSVGFGRPLWRRTAKDGTEYVIAALPLGGYVKMLDEREGVVPVEELHRAFNRQSVAKRVAIVAAGPLFNFMLAVAAYWVVYVAGVTGLKPLIDEPTAGSRAALAGLQSGEQVVEVDGEPIVTWQVLQTELIDAALERDAVQLTVRDRDGGVRTQALDLAGVRVDPEFLFDDIGLKPYRPPMPAVLGEIVPGSAAAAAGLRPGDRVLSINGTRIDLYQELFDWVRAHPGEAARFEVRRDGERREVTAIIATEGGQGKLGAGVDVPAGLWDNLVVEHRLGAGAALPAAVAQTARMSGLTLKMLYRMVLGDVSVKNVSGPIQIAQVAGYTASIGLVSFLSFIAIVSVSLGVLNLLPVPVLDGGHLLYYAIEGVKGSPLSDRAQAIGQQIGVTLLVALMGLAFYNDIVRLVH